MITAAQFKEGLAYAEDNFKNENAPHLKVDKHLIRSKFNLDGYNILDFGCGMGGMSLWYAKNWDCKVHAVDIDGHHIEVANVMKEKYHADNVTFEKRNILDTPLSPKKHDMVFMNDVAEHIPLNILEAIFKELHNGLKDDGGIFVSYPPWRSPYASHLNHVIKIPWIQFYPKSFVDKKIDENNHTIVGDLESSLREAYYGLNHLTHDILTTTTAKSGFKPVYRKSHCILNRLPLLGNTNINFFPFDFLVTKEFLLLKKK